VAKGRGKSKQIQLEYCFDRLSAKKLTLAYELLVPDCKWATGKDRLQKPEKDSANDDGRNIRASVV
jgi:hypothetical protein